MRSTRSEPDDDAADAAELAAGDKAAEKEAQAADARIAAADDTSPTTEAEKVRRAGERSWVPRPWFRGAGRKQF